MVCKVNFKWKKIINKQWTLIDAYAELFRGTCMISAIYFEIHQTRLTDEWWVCDEASILNY